MRHMVIRLLVVALALVGPASAAQQNRASESDLLALTASQPRDIGPLLDLAKLYREQGRLDEAMGMLTRALIILREDRAAAMPAGSVAATPPLPAGRSFGTGGALRVGGDIKAPTKIKDVAPVYPAEARAARIQGIVIIEAVIGQDGTVTGAQILRSVPMLDQAALDAVRQWVFTQTLLNGVPVSVIMTVTVNFSMQ